MKSFAILVIFVVLTMAFTWPVLLNVNTAFDNDGDPLAGICAVEWLGRNLWTRPWNLFEAPLFYPHCRTLETGFHVYLVGLLYFPFRWAVGNPVAAYNLLYIMTLAMDGFSMYLLARYLTKDALAGFLSGAIFAFCPFRAANFQHISLMTNYWTVFSFLALFKFFNGLDTGKKKNLSLFYAAVLLYFFQCTTDIITGMYFGIPFFSFIAYGFFACRKKLGTAAIVKALFSFAVLAVFLLVLVSPLRSFRSDFGQENVGRDLEMVQELSSPLSSYLATPPGNFLYGRITRGFWINARQINFYGATAYILAALSVLSIRRSAKCIVVRLPKRKVRLIQVFNPLFSGNRTALFFLCIFIVAFAISLGPSIHLTPGRRLCAGPYMLVYRFIAPLRTLRTLAALGVVAILSLSVMAGFGLKRLLDFCVMRRLAGRYFLGAVLVILLIVEYAGYPPTRWSNPFFQVPERLPAAYRWLMEQDDDSPIIELPMPWEPEEVAGAFGLDTAAMYWSIYHGRRTVNGVGAFSYPEYKIIVDQMKLFPSRETLDILRFLGVRYVVMHVGRLPRLEWQKEIVKKHPEAEYDWRETLTRAERFSGELDLRIRSGGDRVYEILGASGCAAPEDADRGDPLLREGWRVTAGPGAPEAELAIDGREETAWHSWQRAGLYFQVDLGSEKEIAGIGMLLRNVNECPKNPRVEVSADGSNWVEVDYGGAYLDFIRRLLEDPQERLFRMTFSPVKARYIRMTATRMDNLHSWSIAEVFIYAPA